jgi:hypothetical protein
MPPNPIRIANPTARPLVETAGAGLIAGSQIPFTQLSEAHAADVIQLPPFGTRVGVAVGVVVGVLVGVPTGVMVGVAVGVPVTQIEPMTHT